MQDRRTVLKYGAVGTAGALLLGPTMAFASPATDKRFLFIIQRGAADGVSIVPPVGDPAFVKARGRLAIDPGTAIPLDSMFALHPAMQQTGALYRAGQALFIHAVASPYRDRSHFDGQNVLESGATAPYRLRSGWLNRLITLLPKGEQKAVSFTQTLPLALQGPALATSYVPSSLGAAPESLMTRVGKLYEGDAQFHGLWNDAMAVRSISPAADVGYNPKAMGNLAGDFLAHPAGARIAMIETGGWDTHFEQDGRLYFLLQSLDALIGGMRERMGAVWDRTLVIVATEFGRTVAMNGSNGTDHGTASMAMLLGGAAKGGRVIADWPGLAAKSLLESRDLRPTAALDALIAGALADHYGLDPALVARTLFPDSAIASPMPGLIRT